MLVNSIKLEAPICSAWLQHLSSNSLYTQHYQVTLESFWHLRLSYRGPFHIFWKPTYLWFCLWREVLWFAWNSWNGKMGRLWALQVWVWWWRAHPPRSISQPGYTHVCCDLSFYQSHQIYMCRWELLFFVAKASRYY